MSDLIRLYASARSLEIRSAERKWQLKSAGSLDEIWESLDADDFDEDHLPYWTELWPSSLALTDWLKLNKRQIRGQLCLDLGCGLGLSSIAGQWLGARVTAADFEVAALTHTRHNAILNDVASPALIAMDWRKPPFAAKSFSFIWGADIVYEKRYFKPILSLLESSLTMDGVAWIAEPGRTLFSRFLDLTEQDGFCVKSVSTSKIQQAETPVAVQIWELTRSIR